MKCTTLSFLLGVAGICSASRLDFGLDYWTKNSHKRQTIPKEYQLGARADQSTDANGTALWLPLDEYSGSSFFDRFDFYTGPDPTHGKVNYTDRDTAFSGGLVYVSPDGTINMKGDNTTWLAEGVQRNSVRISSYTQYNGGLFILDLNRAPWGCGTWPAFWTLGSGQWPYNGEIDIIEGVHDNQHNQVAFHTDTGCLLTPTNQTGSIVQVNGKDNLICDGNVNDNSGCAVTEWSRASYGPYFDSLGGGVFVMKWDELGIAIWSFYRPTIPQDILDGSPDPANWGNPSAVLLPDNCNLGKYFANHSIVFDITFCGDWAGNSYSTTDCPGTCDVQLQNPANFVNASWSINWLKVYRKQIVVGHVTDGGFSTYPREHLLQLALSMVALYMTYMCIVW